MKVVQKNIGTCSSKLEVEVEDGIIENVEFTGGCPGNLLAISALVKGMEVTRAIELLDGIKCGKRPTSCGDQLARALKTTL